MRLSNIFMTRVSLVGLAVLALAGCSLAPEYQQPEAPIPQNWKTNNPEIDKQLDKIAQAEEKLDALEDFYEQKEQE